MLSNLNVAQDPQCLKATSIHEGDRSVEAKERMLLESPPSLARRAWGEKATAWRQGRLSCGEPHSTPHPRTVIFLVFLPLLLRSILRSWWQVRHHGL